MFASESQILQRLAVLVVCHGLAGSQCIPRYFLVERPMSWVEAREFCQRHYVDLAVLSSEEQYYNLLNATVANEVSFWLGLQRQSIKSVWQWVSGEDLVYERWFRRNHEGRCASLEAVLKTENKMLARYCDELHMTVCQGPVSPHSVTAGSIGTDHVNLSWNVSPTMLVTSHSYNVTICCYTCITLLYPYTSGSSLMNISISNLTAATRYFIQISAVVVRPDNVTGRQVILQDNPATLQIKTDRSPVKRYKQAVVSLNTPQESSVVSRRQPDTEKSPDQSVEWVWRAAVQAHGSTHASGFHAKRFDLQPFAKLGDISRSVQSLLTLAAPSMLNDYYANLLDCSCNGMVALALGSSVYLWNSDTHSLVGHLEPSPDPGPARIGNLTISCLRWSRDGRALCIGNRRGEIQLWDVDHNQNMRHLCSQGCVVAALSWKQHLLSCGSFLGHIHHFDPRAPASVVGAVVQKEGICSLQWSSGDDLLASGSTEGLLHIWDGDITGVKRSHQPVMTMKQPSAVKALGWCPWQREVIATGGGWKDGELRIWDVKSGCCLTSVNTNSQICSLQWAEKKRYLLTGHGIPHHQITSWTWEFPSLRRIHQLTGHFQRVLHLAINPDNTHIFSAGADQRFHIWTL